MANGQSQTPSEGGGDDQVVEKLNQNGARKSHRPDEVYEDESGAIEFVKSISPKYKGYNGAHLRARLLKNRDELEQVATRVLDNSTDGDQELAKQYQTNPELYQEHKQAVVSKLEGMLSTDVIKGETMRQSIVNRTYSLKTSDISQLKKPSFHKTPYDSIINKEAKKHGIDPRLVKAVIEHESGFDPKAESPVGAKGLMQLMPETAGELGVEDPFDPEQNLRGGIKYLADRLKDSDSLETALAKYNAGMGNVSEAMGKSGENWEQYREHLPKKEETIPYVDSIVGNYQELIRPRMEYDLPVTDYRDIALENKEKYQELGLINEEGKFKYDSPEGAKTFMEKLLDDEELHKELLGDRYDVFQDKLANSNNTGAIDESNPDDMARAWAVYDKFGSEGLTHFLNLKQHYKSGQPVEEQDPSVKDALSFVKNSSKGGFTVQDYISTFFGSEKSPVGKFEIQPVTRSYEMKEGIAKDYNNFTRFWNPTPEGEGDSQAFKQFIGDLHKKNIEREEGSFFGQWINNTLSMLTGDRVSELTHDAQLDANVENNETLQDAAEIAYTELANGYDTPTTRAIKLDMIREAEKDDGAFGVEDLMKTIMANAEDHKEFKNSTAYKINYEQADERTRIAIDVLRSEERYRELFHTAKDGSLLFEPNYNERILQNPSVKPLVSMSWKKESVTDKNGNVVGYVERPGEQDFGESVGNVLGNLGFSLGKFVDETVVRGFGAPMVFESMDLVQSVFGEEFGKDFETNMKRNYEKTWREYFDAKVGQAARYDDAGDIVSGISRFAVPFGLMVYTMGKLGARGLQAPWAVMKSMSKARSAVSGSAAANILGRGSGNLRMAAILRKMAMDAKAGAGFSSRMLKYSVGAIPLEVTAGKRWSLLNTGIADMGLEKALDTIGQEKNIDLQKIYRTSNRITQIGMDVLANESLGLLLDNLIGLTKYGISKTAQKTGLKTEFRGLNFNYEKMDFDKGSEVVFSSDTRRTVHNMFNGLQDMPIGEMAESMSNKYTGRAFLVNPENQESLSDAVVGFTEQAHPIFSEAKRTIRSSIEYYDKRLGGKMRLNRKEIEDRVETVYNEFMNRTAKNMKETLEAIGGGEYAPLKIAQALESKPASVKGTVPYFRDGDDTPRHIMTLAEAEELASESPNYIVKPTQNAKFARVFEVDDGLWSADLARRIKGLYKGDSVDDVLEKQFQRHGVRKGTQDLSQEQLQTKENIEMAVRRVFGKEISVGTKEEGITTKSLGVEGKKPSRPENVGIIMDVDEDGFILQMQDGSMRRGVQIDEFEEQRQILAKPNKKSGINEENFDNVEEGGVGTPTGNRAENLGSYLDRELVNLYPNLTSQARGMIQAAADGELPSVTNDNLLRIAQANGVKATINDSPQQIVNRLAKKGSGRDIKNMLKKALDAQDKSVKLMKADNSTKAFRAAINDDIFQKSGFMSNFMKSINKYAKYAKENSATARAMAKMLGVDNTDGYRIFGKNQGPITRFNSEKIGEDGLKTNFVFKWNADGVDEHFINVRSIGKEDAPSVWIRDESGSLIMNPKWRRIERNVTIKEDGTLPLYTPVQRGNETWYREAKAGEDGVFINVQKPTKNNNLTLEEVHRTGVDAVEREIDGSTHYRLVNERQQAIDPTLIKKHPSKAYNATTTVKKKPSKAVEQAASEEAEEAIEEVVKQAGVGKAVQYGLVGGIADHLLGTTFADMSGENQDGFNIGGIFTTIGFLLGSKRIRTRTIPAVWGSVNRSVKNLFDRDFSTTYRVEKQAKEAGEMNKMGLYHDPLNKYDKAKYDKFADSINNLRKGGVKTWDRLKQNEWVMSSLIKIKNMDHPVADKFFEVLETLNQTVNEIASTSSRRFASKISSLSDEVREQIDPELLSRLENHSDPYTLFTREIGPKKVREIFPEGADATRSKEQFDLAFFRLMNSGAELDAEGNLVRRNTPTVERMYSMSKGEAWDELDRQLMNDPLFREYLDSHKNFFHKVMNRWQTQLDQRIDKAFGVLDEETKEPFRELLDSNESFAQWKARLSERKQKQVNRIYRNNQGVKDMVGYHDTKMKFTDLDGRYYPQIISETKMETSFKRFVAEKGYEDLTDVRQKELFDQHMAETLYNLNHTKKERRILREYNKETKSFDAKHYSDQADAEAELSRIAASLRKTEGHAEDARFVERNKADFIEKETKQAKRNGELVLDDDGKPVTYDIYKLRVPDDYDVNIFDINTKNFTANVGRYRSFYDDITNHTFVRNSNFLERPRIKHLPHEILETDIDNVIQRYSSDVGKRIHNAENNMFDEAELRLNYLDDLGKYFRTLDYDKDYIEHLENEMVNMYNIQNNIINKTGEQLTKERKFRGLVDLFKNALFSRFGFGFGWYNMFEWAVVGPHLTSNSQIWGSAKLFTTNKQALNNTERLMRSWNIVRKEIGSVNPDFERYGILTENENLNALNSFFTKAANYVGDFSVTKDLGGKVFGWDTRNWGMARLGTDSFMGSNYVSTSIVAQASLGEARYLTRVLKQMDEIPEGSPRVVRLDGKTWTREDAIAKLERLGINRSDQQEFLRRSDKFASAVEQIRGNEKLNMEEFGKADFDDHIHDVFKIMQTATENFHGTNKMYRPQGWNSPLGKALSTYSTYPFNFAMQTVKRRMWTPISNWNNNYKTLLKEGGSTNMMKVLYELKKGNIQGLRNMGLTDEAIEAIPTDAYRAILKHFSSTLGVSTAGFLTMDAITDLMAYPINDATGQEQWNRLRYRNTLNPNAPKEDQITWANIDEDFGIDSFMNLAHYMISTFARSSGFGRYGDFIENSGRLSRDGILGLTPMTDMINTSFKDMMQLSQINDLPTTLTNKSKKFIINNTPILGANIFGELRKSVYEQWKFKRENNGQPTPRFMDESTGEIMTIDDLQTTLE